ncbi:MAG: hypothetical protein RID53_02105 [Coleofasciculus sp. B1-GNL1-01]|uniref:surface-adhesin E family protein n=1 Tax=Coleofasciculus sp. B1-GNL1-01 TaxID=3068484 RepID=UPI0032FEE643
MTNPLISLNRRSLQGVLTLLSLTSAILISPAAIAGQWVRVKTDARNNAFHVDVSTIEGRGRLRYFWSNIIYGQPNPNLVPGQEVYSTTYYIAVDCQNQIYQVRFVRFLDADGQTIEDYIALRTHVRTNEEKLKSLNPFSGKLLSSLLPIAYCLLPIA